MEGLRIIAASGQSPLAPCGRCQATGCPWDRIGSNPGLRSVRLHYTSACYGADGAREFLAAGEAEPLVERLVPHECAVCNKPGAVPYLTFPLHARDPMSIDLCPSHFHALLGRRLDRYAYRILCRQLREVGLSTKHIFLLHEAFYDERGHPLQPVQEP